MAVNKQQHKILSTISGQLAEDPNRNPHEKETAINLEGDATYATLFSFKRVTYVKLLKRPEFRVGHLNVLSEDGREHTVDSLGEVAADPSLTVIGAAGQLPVGAISIGTPRNSNSHAEIVK